MTVVFIVLLAIIFYTYIGYGILLYLLVWIKEKIYPRKEMELPAVLPDVTLFITAYNEEDVVDVKMRNSYELDYPKDKLHIVWVTDGSNDRTNDILKNYEDITLLYSPERKGKTAAMNRGVQFIKDSIIVFTDANTMINKEAVSEIVKCFSDERVGCVSGEKRIATKDSDIASSSGEGFYWRYESALKSLDSRLYSTVGSAGELFAVRTPLFKILPDNILLDDFVLSMSVNMQGYKNMYCPSAYAVENGSLNMAEEKKRKVRIAAGGLQAIWYLRPLLNIFRYGVLSFQYVSHRVLRWTITPLAMALLIPVSIYLLTQETSTIYLVFVCLLCLFYLAAFAGYRLAEKEIKNKVLFVPYYFLFMNINVFKGGVYLSRKKSGTWEKSKRRS